MKRKLLNPYKWKRKVKRGVVTSSDSFDIEARLNLRPSQERNRWRKNIYSHDTNGNKNKFKLFLLVSTSLALFILCFFHPYFSVRTLSVEGLERTDEKKVIISLEQLLQGKHFLIFPTNNYFSLNVNNIYTQLQSQYSFQSIQLEKKFPHSLTVKVVEKPPALIYDNGKEYILIGQKGEKLETLRAVGDGEWQIIKQVVSSTASVSSTAAIPQMQEVRIHIPDTKQVMVAGKSYPLVYDKRVLPDSNSNVISEDIIQGIQKWNDLLWTHSNIHVSYIEILENGTEGFFKTTEGWGIYANFTNSDQAFPLFMTLLPQVDKKKMAYLDVRYLNRVYWK